MYVNIVGLSIFQKLPSIVFMRMEVMAVDGNLVKHC